MNILYVFWQNPETRKWTVVGKLERAEENAYAFSYTRGALDASNYGFVPFGRMVNLCKRYVSDELFPLFSNRILSQTRSEFPQYVRWMDAENHKDDKLFILGRTGGTRKTDSLFLYAKPTPNEKGEFDLSFFCHGIRYTSDEAKKAIASLSPGDRLSLVPNDWNEHDPNAVEIRILLDGERIGYVPRFFAQDVRACLKVLPSEEIRFLVSRVNREAPYQYRLLCRITCAWPTGFEPCSCPEFDPASESCQAPVDNVAIA